MRAFLVRTWKWLGAAALAWIVGASIGVRWATPEQNSVTYEAYHKGFGELGQKFFFDLSIAIFIAIAVRELIERAYEQRQAAKEEEAEATSLSTIFKKVYGSFFDDDLIEEARSAIFSHRLVRRDFDIEYTLSHHPKSARLVYMGLQVKYEVTNVSKLNEKFEPGLMLGNVMARFPNDPLREKPTVLKFKVGSHDFSADELSTLNNLIPPSIPNPRLPLGSYDLAPGQSLAVHYRIRVIKLANDSETLRMGLPTKNISVAVFNHMGSASVVELEPIHAKPFLDREDSMDGMRWVKRSPNLFLPNNGWVVYWNDLSHNLSDDLAAIPKQESVA
ncbi:MAG: hypothetical protein HYZ40_16100 [Rhodospirillales bacterium]|nr:hypothetical protein [Rhodospirillales bacterium]